MSWQQVAFHDPRCVPAQRLVELNTRAAELRHESRVADLAESSTERERERKYLELQTAEARALALGQQVDNLPALRGSVTRAEKAHAEAVTNAEQLRQAVIVLDAERVRVARENIDELLAELAEDHDAMRERADDAVSHLGAAAAAMRAIFAATMALANNVDPALSRSLRDPLTAEQILAAGSAPPLFNQGVTVRKDAPEAEAMPEGFVWLPGAA